MLAAIATARGEGGTILCGGGRHQPGEPRLKGGFFVQPTLIEGLDHTCVTNREEIFGPVATLQPFRDEREALGLVNSTKYGLSASVWTADLKGPPFCGRHRYRDGLLNCWLVRDLRTHLAARGSPASDVKLTPCGSSPSPERHGQALSGIHSRR